MYHSDLATSVIPISGMETASIWKNPIMEEPNQSGQILSDLTWLHIQYPGNKTSSKKYLTLQVIKQEKKDVGGL